MKIYFSGSIRGGRGDQERYARIIQHLNSFGTVLTEHVGYAEVPGIDGDASGDERVYRRDMIWLREADVVVAEVSTPSLGVGYEIAQAEQMGKRILCLYRDGADRKLSAMIRGNRELSHQTYHTWDELVSIVDEFMRSA